MNLSLNETEKKQILDLTRGLEVQYGSAENPDFLAQAVVHAHELPLRVRKILNEFRLFEPSVAMCRISGYPIDDREIGPTPSHWKERQQRCIPVKEEILLVLLGSLLGDVIAWSTQQDGAIVHDIAPVKGHETEQLGSGSAEELTWHTEDAFHSFRGDYLGMMCLRNPDHVPTTFAAVDISGLDEETVDLLLQPLYTIRPDNSHLLKNRVDLAFSEEVATAHGRIDQMNSNPEKVAVLFGARDAPYCRLDPYFMDPPEQAAARRALETIIQEVNSRIREVEMEPGEFCFIDNFRAVHGRRSFKARFDGTDRWLKRINITRDLRRSRAVRSAPGSRVLC